MALSLETRFWSKVSKTPTCWLWTGCTVGFGHGRFTIWKQGTKLAHRLAFRLVFGREPREGLFVLHTCDVPACVNPDHLYEGTAADNMRDCVSRHRHGSATKTHCAQGHAFTPENTYLYTGRGLNERQCRTCSDRWKTNHRQRTSETRNAKRREARRRLREAPPLPDEEWITDGETVEARED